MRGPLALAALLLGGCLCGPGQRACGDQCTNLLDDPSNCGSCGHTCDYHCVSGACVEPPSCGPLSATPSCDDGDPCNGVETCSGTDERAHCFHGTPMVCADGIACTLDTCHAGVCSSTPNDSACGAGTCDATLGCVQSCTHAGCGLVPPQCGCPAGQACQTNTVATMCGTPGTHADGATCTSQTDCQAGSTCIALDTARSVQICAPFCDRSDQCGTTQCVGQGLFDPSDATVGVCSVACNLVTSAACPSAGRCVLLTTSAGVDYTQCIAPIGAQRAGGVCTGDADCGRGLICLQETSGTNHCFAWCRTTTDCAALGRTCRPVTPAVVVNGISYGACQ